MLLERHLGVSFQKHRYGEEVIHEGYQDKRVQEDAEAERPHGQNAERTYAGYGAECEREVP